MRFGGRIRSGRRNGRSFRGMRKKIHANGKNDPRDAGRQDRECKPPRLDDPIDTADRDQNREIFIVFIDRKQEGGLLFFALPA